MYKNKLDFIFKANSTLNNFNFCIKDCGGNIGIFLKSDNGSDVLVSPISIFPIAITKCIGETVEVFTEISTFYNGELQPAIKHSGKLNGIEDKMLRIWGPKVVPHLDSDSICVMMKVFYHLTKAVSENKQYLIQGWTDNYDAYVFGNLLVKADSIDRVQCKLTKKDLIVEAETKPNVGKFILDNIINITGDGELGLHLLVFSVLCFARQRLVENYAVCPGFVMFVIGPTNSRKTSIVNAICNPVGMPNASFEDTEKAIVQALKEPNYAPLIVDDFNIASTDKKRKFEAVVRNCGDLTTNSHKVVGGKVCHNSVANMCIITGESIPQLQVSSMPRMLIYELTRESIDLQALSEIQKNPDIVVALFVAIIQALFDDALVKEIYRNMLVERQSLQETFANERIFGRYLDMIAWMQSGWEVLTSIFPELCSIDYPGMIRKRILLQHEKFKDDPVEAFKFCLKEMLREDNDLKVYYADDSKYGPENPDLIFCGSKLFVVSKRFYKKMSAFYKDEIGKDFPCTSERKLRMLLYQEGLISYFENGMLTTQIMCGGNRFSGYYLFKNLIIKG